MGNRATGIFFSSPVLQQEPQIQPPITRNLRHSDDVMAWGSSQKKINKNKTDSGSRCKTIRTDLLCWVLRKGGRNQISDWPQCLEV